MGVMRIWLLHIEPFEERYSAQWLRWFVDRLENCVPVDAPTLTEGVETGQWLDVYGTHYFKALQLAEFADALVSGTVEDNDVVLVMDAWNPAVISLAYMRDCGNIKFKIVGLLHAGTWDPHDFLTQKGCGDWARGFEWSCIQACDAVCVATDFHKQLILGYFGGTDLVGDKIRVTGFPMDGEDFVQYAKIWDDRPPRVVFPHRLAPEKQPRIFEALRDAYRELYPESLAQWVRTYDVCDTKAEYYEVLGSSRVVFSAAQQETWGIAMIEGALLGCYPYAPNALSYPETLPPDSLWNGNDGLVYMAHEVHRMLNAEDGFEYPFWLYAKWDTAIEEIELVCKEVAGVRDH